ncbi:squalene/phytoene synthase family protein [Oleiagrimonas sp. C23AA]|uniref:squalene/phytoene synthase family protein n=1 Tax=Oleiagrimonas sp. C23AA TaxID=2719047 RepID=UPI00141F64DE|nr:squalene/phytoene synthase family protein [Oleiagrimonas sp. C23AA]NII10216.1 squalene/phytoene synthase family protein [Oleiagrimonas sp. C23AA]
MNDVALQSFVNKWLTARPAMRVALAFVDPAERDAHVALAAFEQELIEAAYGISETHVAQTKLNWWAEELAGAAASGGRHPLVRALFASERANRVQAQQWLAPVLAAQGHFDQATPSDFDAQLAQAEPFHGALAELETAWWFGAGADASRAARMATLGHVLAMTAQLERSVDGERLALPMARLARHDLNREGLKSDNPARREAVRAQLTDLRGAYRKAWAQPGPLSVFRGLQARVDTRVAGKARGQADPLAALSERLAQPGGPATAFAAWSATRQARAAQR